MKKSVSELLKTWYFPYSAFSIFPYSAFHRQTDGGALASSPSGYATDPHWSRNQSRQSVRII